MLAASLILSACGPAGQGSAALQATAAATPASSVRVLATETYLADMAQNVAGDRLKVGSLLPAGVDPHEFEPAPADVAKVAQCDVLIVNGAGLEAFLNKLLQSAGGQHRVIVASDGLASRTPRPGEQITPGEEDPHFWMDPTRAVKYVENIRDGLSQAEPGGASVYAGNAAAYISTLRDLDTWIAGQVGQVPADRRLLVTNHESLGYYADRYGFQVVGTVIPSVSSDAAPSAQQMASLIDAIRALHAPAIFLEAGANTQLAQQVAADTGVKVVTGLYTHWLTPPGGPASTYIDMMKYDTQLIVNALK